MKNLTIQQTPLDIVLKKQNDNVSGLRPDNMKKAIEYAEQNNIPFIGTTAFNTAINHLFFEFNKRSGRYAKSTIKRLQLSWNVFVRWCTENNVSALPADNATVENFFIEKSKTHHRNSLSVFKWAVSRTHEICGCPDPTKDAFTRDTYMQLRREKIESAEKIKQATPFTHKHLELLLSNFEGDERLLHKRNLALAITAYETMLREAEIARIRLCDIDWKEDGTARVTIPFTKTNKTGRSEIVAISEQAVDVIQHYLDGINVSSSGYDENAYLFQKITKYNLVPKLKVNDAGQTIHTPISTRTIDNIFHWIWIFLKDENKLKAPFTSHSARVGAAQDLLKEGFSIPQIQQSGRWSSPEMVVRYGKDILAEESAMAQSRRKSR